MNDKNRQHLPQHKTALNYTSEKQLAGSLAPNIGRAHAATASVSPAYESPRGGSAAMTSVPSAYENPRGGSAAMASVPSAYENPRGGSAAMTSVPSAYENPRGGSAAMASVPSAYENPRGGSAAMTSVPSAYENPRGGSAAMASVPSAYENSRGGSAAMTSVPSAYENPRSGSAAMTSVPSVYENPRGGSTAVTGRTVEAHQYQQKQTTLKFPNIIKNRLSIDSFLPLVPRRPYAPLPVPPTAVTDEAYEEISPENTPAPSPELVPITNHKPVFIVHGHDHETRDDVSKFVSNWGLTATILDKQANKGRTIIEKFEDCADETSFAIVLLTPDDVGASVKDKTHLKYRARQNVIYEWGYFSGSIGRERVCILYKGNLELPSDTQGVVYVRMDDNGEWKQSIVREMESIGLLIDANKI